MALSGAVNSGTFVGGSYLRLEWTATQNIGANQSTITARLYLVLNGGTSVFATETGNIVIDGATSGFNNGSQSRGPNGTHLLHTYVRTISHASNGTKSFSASGAFTSGWGTIGSRSVSGSWTLDTIPRSAPITAVYGNFNDDFTNPWVEFTKYTGTVNVWFELPSRTGTTQYALRSNVNSRTTWTLSEAEKNALRAALNNVNSTTIRYVVNTVIGGSQYWNIADRTYTIVNAKPTFADFDFLDTNGATTTITGNDQYLIQGYSTLRATILSADKAVAIKEATMDKYTFNVAGISVEQAYSASDINKDIGVISASTNQELTVTARDSRGNTTPVAKTVNIVPYSNPNIVATGERDNNFEANTTISISATVSLLSVASVVKNAVNATSGVRYRYKQAGGAFGSWVNRTSSLNTSTGAVTTTPFTLSLDNTKQFDFEIEVTDKLVTTVYTMVVPVGIPAFRIGTDGKIYNNENMVASYHSTLVMPSSGTFNKADYPFLKYIVVQVVGGGGGSGGCTNTSASQTSSSSSGGGGGYSKKKILASDLSSSETVIVGAGGSGGGAGTNNGSSGGTSSFGAHLQATGGGGGAFGGLLNNTDSQSLAGADGGVGSGGDLNLYGGQGLHRINHQTRSRGGCGGSSFFAPNTESSGGGSNNSNSAGVAGKQYGGGAAGASNSGLQTSVAGASGASGVVIIDLYF